MLELFYSPIPTKTKKVKPVIKWTGGKYNEFSMFAQYIPSFNRYFEPFFGGGGVFFNLQPRTPAYLNDKSKDLANFYGLMQDKDFKQQLFYYADAWDEAGRMADELQAQLLPAFKAFLSNKTDLQLLKKTVAGIIDGFSTDHLLFQSSFIINPDRFIKKLVATLVDKCRRIKAICDKENRQFADNELHDHLETGIKSGLYLFAREITNLGFTGKLSLTPAKSAANWYFVRELCYASMFRYNSKGEFNIPYGGIAYNKKNFRQKVEHIFSKEVQQLFANAKFHNLDFADFIALTQPGDEDFIFLDPPYDSEFSAYDQNSFTKDDQVRLRDVLFETTAKWMVVIKETPFIRSLYESPKCRLLQFDKTYTYNVRGRNNRDTKHLIIVNYNT